jgi:hypothetical protein
MLWGGPADIQRWRRLAEEIRTYTDNACHVRSAAWRSNASPKTVSDWQTRQKSASRHPPQRSIETFSPSAGAFASSLSIASRIRCHRWRPKE